MRGESESESDWILPLYTDPSLLHHINLSSFSFFIASISPSSPSHDHIFHRFESFLLLLIYLFKSNLYLQEADLIEFGIWIMICFTAFYFSVYYLVIQNEHALRLLAASLNLQI